MSDRIMIAVKPSTRKLLGEIRESILAECPPGARWSLNALVAELAMRYGDQLVQDAARRRLRGDADA